MMGYVLPRQLKPLQWSASVGFFYVPTYLKRVAIYL